jgi:tRNA-2-methylthio-N6-dimethylallyladenosine synthase
MHLPVQHGDNEILKRMNRGYTVEHFNELLAYAREKMPGLVVTTDIITGFPGETETAHEATLRLLETARFDSAYTFIFSPRTGTPAAKMEDQIPEDVKKRRLQDLMDIQNRVSLEINLEMEGNEYPVIAEGPTRQDPENWYGRTSGNKMIIFKKPKTIQIGDTLTVKVTQAQTWVLKGEVDALCAKR